MKKAGFLLPVTIRAWSFLLLVVVTICGCGQRDEEQQAKAAEVSCQILGKYSGWLCGMVSHPGEEDSADVLTLNPQNGDVKKIITLNQINSNQTCAVSPDGNWVAYTDWVSSDTSEGIKLIVKNVFTKEEKVFLENNGCNPLLIYMIWLPDNHRLLLNLSLKDQQYYTEALGVLDIDTNQLRILDQGGVWQGNTSIDTDMDWEISLTTQAELDELIRKYGGKESLPVEENGSYDYVIFGAPALSPDQKTAVYAVNFSRNAASWDSETEEMPRLTLASGIFQANLEEGGAKLIYANAVQKSCMGNVAWLDADTLVFDRYYNELSKGDCEIVVYHLSTGRESVISARKEGETAQKIRGVHNGRIAISTDGESGEKFIQMNASGQERTETTFFYEGKPVSVWRFYPIP